MSQERKKFSPPPKKYQPKGLTFLHEDRDIIVVNKESGLLTVGTDKVKEQTALFLLNHYVRKGDFKSRKQVFIVHRLDRDTSGILIFAKTEQAQRHLQDEWEHFQKSYLAVVAGVPEPKEATLSSYLAENSVHRVYSTPDQAKGRLAITAYRVTKAGAQSALLEIDLHTGRKNQIRVQLADIGHPVLGDKKYGIPQKGGSQPKVESPIKAKRLALHAAKLVCTHPFSKEPMTFEAAMPGLFHSLIK